MPFVQSAPVRNLRITDSDDDDGSVGGDGDGPGCKVMLETALQVTRKQKAGNVLNNTMWQPR